MKITIYTDGGCYPNPGNGAWSFVCCQPYHEESGHEAGTTNNRMEIMAVLRAVEFALTCCPEEILIYSDSQYVVKGVNWWMKGWYNNNWMKQDNGEWVPVKNSDLWKQLYNYRGKFKMHWVRGHNGSEFNELADELVRTEYQKVFGGEMKH